MYSFVFLALVAVASANVVVDSKCPDVTTADNFDFSAYGQGTWYEVARYPNSAEKGANCGWGEYTPAGEVANVKNYHLLNNKIKVIEGSHKSQGSGKITVSLPYGAGGALAEHTLNVLAYNGEYLVGYYCKETKTGRQDFAWVLSRSKVLSADAKAAVDNIVKESKILDSSKFLWPSFSDEACKLNV